MGRRTRVLAARVRAVLRIALATISIRAHPAITAMVLDGPVFAQAADAPLNRSVISFSPQNFESRLRPDLRSCVPRGGVSPLATATDVIAGPVIRVKVALDIGPGKRP